MSVHKEIRKLEADHSHEAIKVRMEKDYSHNYLSDAVLGGIDGCVTTFAVVAGTVGAGFPYAVAMVLGVANLVADGFSMAVSNYQATKSERDLVEKARREEERHIDLIPEGEREEVRQIFARKGIKGKTLEEVVKAVTADRKLWVDTMVAEEFGLQIEGANPLYSSLVTFGAFVFVGFLPLIPFLLHLPSSEIFLFSSVIAGLAFLAIGVIRGFVLHLSMIRTGLETLFTGGAAAFLSYIIGYWLRTSFLN
jgi:VIT1/CCC1 family predicted Fe2+/Mn2+ transporter